MAPTTGNGKICYLEIPAVDVAVSSNFYRSVFGWTIRTRGDGATAFDDTVGAVSGTWVLGRPIQKNAGILVYIMVDDVAKTLAVIVEYGGTVVKPIPASAPEIIATFSDPAGNVLGLYQEPA